MHQIDEIVNDFVAPALDRKSTRLNSSHRCISYAVFCLKKKKPTHNASGGSCVAPTHQVGHCLRGGAEVPREQPLRSSRDACLEVPAGGPARGTVPARAA